MWITIIHVADPDIVGSRLDDDDVMDLEFIFHK